MAALGLFDVQGHTRANPTFQFGSPLFDKVTIRLDRDYYPGEKLVIETVDNSRENMFVQGVSFNGEPVVNCWIGHGRLTGGGTLVFKMGPEPNTYWGVETPPPSMSTDKK